MFLHAAASRTSFSFDPKSTQLHYVGPFQRFEELQYDNNYMEVKTTCQVGYWRKFNALHKYIVDRFACGVDECQPIALSHDDIVKILELLKKITIENARVLLPPAEGFCFGSQFIDNWYMKNVEYSIKVFQLALDFLEKEFKDNTLNPDNPFKEYEDREIYYQASW